MIDCNHVQRISLGDFLAIAAAVTGESPRALLSAVNIGSAESALHAPFAGFGEMEFFPTLTAKAAVLCSRLIRNHPLPDGNKRAAYATMIYFIEVNGCLWEPRAPDEERAMVIEGLASKDVSEQEFAGWLKRQIVGAV